MKPPRYLLDTNTCIYIINRRPTAVFKHFVGLHIGQIAISSITGAELAFGVAKSGSPRNAQALDKFLAPLDILPFDEPAMRRYGTLRRARSSAPSPSSRPAGSSTPAVASARCYWPMICCDCPCFRPCRRDWRERNATSIAKAWRGDVGSIIRVLMSGICHSLMSAGKLKSYPRCNAYC